MTFNRKMFISNRQAVAHDMCQGLRDMSSRIVCLLLYKILKSQITHKKDSTIHFMSRGYFHYSGYKFHQWFYMIWMEKMIGFHNPDVVSMEIS